MEPFDLAQAYSAPGCEPLFLKAGFQPQQNPGEVSGVLEKSLKGIPNG